MSNRLLEWLDRVVEDDSRLLERVRELAEHSQLSGGEAWRGLAAERLIARAAGRSALTGALSALPALLPGLGLATAAGGAFVEVALLARQQVELSLSLFALYGWPIGREDVRRRAQLAALLGGLEEGGQSLEGVELGRLLWRYGPRELWRLLLLAEERWLSLGAARLLFKGLPAIGVLAGAELDRRFTRGVGERLVEFLEAAPPRLGEVLPFPGGRKEE